MAQQPKPKATDPVAAATIRCSGCKTTVKGTDRRWMCPLCKVCVHMIVMVNESQETAK
jgi:rubrerythrin